MKDLNKLPLLDVSNPDERVKILARSSRRLRDAFIELGMEHMNHITGRFGHPNNERLYKLRDTILYRLGGLLYHLRLLLDVGNNQNRILQENPFNEEIKVLLLVEGREQQIYLFDSLVFHAISFFDYFGSLIDFFGSVKGTSNLTWNAMFKSISDRNNPMSSHPVAPVVKLLHAEFVDPLYEHRSHLIHRSTDIGSATASLEVMTATTDFIVYAPKRIVKRIAKLKKESEMNELTLRYVAFWICENTIDGGMNIVLPILKHVEENYELEKKGSPGR